MENGGYAFPVPDFDQGGNRRTSDKKGMTLRDYFAAAALQGLIASGTTTSYSGLGEMAYQAADKMLAAREK